jgi:1-acyl-sn-glycerol-3-phosphate acyltransferase
MVSEPAVRGRGARLERAVVRGETRRRRWLRRAISLPAVFVGLALAVATAPLWIPIAFLVDALRGFRSAVLRGTLFLVVYLACEVVGVLATVVISATTRRTDARGGPSQRYFDRHFALQRWWAGTLTSSLVRLFRLRFEVEGIEHLDRPMILLLSHASIADTLLASELVSRPHHIHLRYVLKQELLVDPCLDIVGHRLPNYFVDRESDNPKDALGDVKQLVADLRPNEGVLIYPEGTRFSEAKRERVIQRLLERGDERGAERARALRHTLLPRLGGTIALLRANPGLPIVIGAHTGFEAVARPLDAFAGSLLDARIALRFWRFPARAVPVDPDAQADWLFAQWQRVDRWIGARRAAADQSSSR